MQKTGRRRIARKQIANPLEELQQGLLNLQDDLAETMACTALLCDGLCGILSENASDIDPRTHSGARFAATWLKQRHEKHTAALQAACTKLCEIRDQ